MGAAWTCTRSKATDAKKERRRGGQSKKKRETTMKIYMHGQELQLAHGGGISLTGPRVSLIKEEETRV